MSHCTDCNDSILNGQVSLIPDPVCHDNCGTETPCEGIGTYTDCVTMNNALTCIGSISGVTLSSVLTMLDTKLCQVITGKCTVSIDANDTCCGYLGDKLIAGTGVTITKNIATASSGCKTLTIAADECNTWTQLTKANLGLANGWVWVGDPYEKPAVSSVKNCIVRLAGTVFKTVGTAPLNAQVTIGTLPAGKRPLKYRRFPIVLTSSLFPKFIPSMLTIAPTGEMTFLVVIALTSPTPYTISFDGISFETNTLI